MSLRPGLNALWPTPVGAHRFAGAAELNPLLARMFGALRATQAHARGEPGDAAFFASTDDLLQRIQIPEWQQFVRFVLESLQHTVSGANAGAWPGAKLSMRIEIAGMWFQCSNRGAFHDLHNHGNCSWSGVYFVQVDPLGPRHAHPVFGALNGVTRFYGPYLGRLGGAHIDLGNAYLQRPQHDVQAEEGLLVVFPSYLEHKALPYEGERDRIVISFNAAIHAAEGDDRLFAYSSA